jgi:ABC-type dipeptide/oligopeptide/nickel transport system permease component
MTRYVLTRLATLLVTLLLLSLGVFLLMHSIPGGPFDLEGGQKGIPVPPAVRAEILKTYGLDKPLHIQYLNYLWRALHLDFGRSFFSPGETVAQLIGRTWIVSIQLGLVTFALALVVGLALGIWSATHQNTWIDYVTTTFAVGGTVFPSFVVGIALLVVFAVILQWLPSGGWDGPQYRIMPVIAFFLLPMSTIARYTRSSMVEHLKEDYVRTARSKGLTEQQVVMRHALRNALIPILTILGPLVADLLTGSFFIETLFRVPGLGRYFTTSILNRDYPMIMGTTLLFAALLSIVNLIIDLLYAVVDPRVRLAR